MITRRPLSRTFAGALDPRNYLLLWRMAMRYTNFFGSLYRFVSGRGSYPYVFGIRTPRGLVTLTAKSYHDLLTVNEVFCREDYRADDRIGTAVDIGANIGASALYFLTRNDRCRVWLFEPDPRNIPRLREHLRGYEDRYELSEHAVADFTGPASFGLERSGRYGGIGKHPDNAITVESLDINDVLASIPGTIDVLKIDTEGLEIRIVQAIDRQHLERIRTIYFDADYQDPGVIHPDLFDQRIRFDVCRLANRSNGRK